MKPARRYWAMRLLIALLALLIGLPTALDKVPHVPRWVAIVIVLLAGVATTFLPPALQGLEAQRRREKEDGGRRVEDGLPLLSLLECPIRSVQEQNPYDLGVSYSEIAARYAPLGRPPYVPRHADMEIDEAIRTSNFVMIAGWSKAGKSRSAFEALMRIYPSHSLVAPRREAHQAGLSQMFQLLQDEDLGPEPVILWLDDIQDYIKSNALTVRLLGELSRFVPRVVIVATVRESELERLLSSTSDDEVEVNKDTGEVISRASIIRIQPGLGPAETLAAKKLYPNENFIDGIGAHFVGAPLLIEKLLSGRESRPEGVAVVLAAIDCYRIGLVRPLSRTELLDLAPLYYLSRKGAARPDFAAGLEWALASVIPGVALLYAPHPGIDALYPHDYAIAYCDGELEQGRGHRPIPPHLWRQVIERLEPWEAFGVGMVAVAREELAAGKLAFTRASASFDQGGATAHIALGQVTWALGDHDGSLVVFEQGFSRFGDAVDPAVRERGARALVCRGFALGKINRRQEEIATYDEVLLRYGEEEDPIFRELLSGCQLNKGLALTIIGQHEAALPVFRDAAIRAASAEGQVAALISARALCNTADALDTLGQYDEALLTCEELLDRLGEHLSQPSDDSFVECIARATLTKGVVLGKLGRLTEQLSTYDRLGEQFASSTSPEIRGHAISAMLNQAWVLAHAGRAAESLEALNRVVSIVDSDRDPRLRKTLGQVLAYRGEILLKLGQHEEALKAYEAALGELGVIGRRSALAQIGKANVFLALSRIDEAILGYDNALSQFDPSGSDDQDWALGAFVNKSAALLRMKRYEEAIAMCDSAFQFFGQRADPGFADQLGRLSLNRGAALSALDRTQEALQAYDEGIAKVAQAQGGDWEQSMAFALKDKAEALVKASERGSAVATLDHLLSFLGTREEFQAIAVDVLMRKATLLLDMDQTMESLAVCQEVITRFGHSSDPAVRAGAGVAFMNETSLLRRLDRPDEVIAVADDCLLRYGRAPGNLELQAAVCGILVNKAGALAELDRYEEALAVCEQAFQWFHEATDVKLCARLGATLLQKSALLNQLGHKSASLEALDQIVNMFQFSPAADLQQFAAMTLIEKAKRLDEFEYGPTEVRSPLDSVLRLYGATAYPAVAAVVEEAKGLLGQFSKGEGRSIARQSSGA